MVRSAVWLMLVSGTLGAMQAGTPPKEKKQLRRQGRFSDPKKKLKDQWLDQSNQDFFIAHAVQMIEDRNISRLRHLLESKKIDFLDQKTGNRVSFDLLVTAIEKIDIEICFIFFEYGVNVNAPNPHIPSLTFLNRAIRKYNTAQGEVKILLFRLCQELMNQGALVTEGCIKSANMGNHTEIIELLQGSSQIIVEKVKQKENE